MRTIRLYQNQTLHLGQTIQLDAAGFHHAIKVLRLTQGDWVTVFNGQGGAFAGQLTDVTRKLACLQLTHFLEEDNTSPLKLNIGQVMSRGERMDWVMQKTTELGVQTLTPLTSEYCEVKFQQERLSKKVTHWQKIILGACEQCGVNKPPVLHPPTQLVSWLKTVTTPVRLLLHPAPPDQQLDIQQYLTHNPGDVTVLIGPEGGFSQTETLLAQQAGFVHWQLGPRILRTETAPIAALSILQYLLGDLNG